MKKIKPTESELEILDILWTLGKATVKEVNERLCRKREVGYTTTLKIMQIMYDKKMLKREKEGRSHIYTPLVQKEDTQGYLLDKILQSAFSGSASKLVMRLIDRNNTSQNEIDEIKKYLSEIENKDGVK